VKDRVAVKIIEEVTPAILSRSKIWFVGEELLQSSWWEVAELVFSMHSFVSRLRSEDIF
jgi:hypothetical protein